MPSFMRSLIVEIGFLIIFEMDAKLRIGLEALPISHVPNLRSKR
jgi:hypothetical protein